MHTIKIIAAGLLLLGACLFVGRMVDAAGTSGLATAVKVFVPLWLLCTLVNLWVGVSRAGYSVADEAPIALVVFAVPAAIALLAWWRLWRA